MYALLRKPLLALLCLALACPALASHYLGYDLTYKTEGSSWVVLVDLYTDCHHGDPTAVSQDNPLNYALFQPNGVLFRYDTVLAYQSVPVAANALPGCLQAEETACVNKRSFRIVIPQVNGKDSLWFVNQRCCLVAELSNLLKPIEQGLTIATLLRKAGINSSPVFNRPPETTLCTGKSFAIDCSATDADGDSLVYRLSPIYQGGSAYDAKPNVTSLNFQPVVYKAPADINHPFMGDGRISLDPGTGIARGVCYATGVYMLGIACDEYRNGRLIGTIYRTLSPEFTSCSGTIAQVAVDSAVALTTSYADSLIAVQCQGSTVVFSNNSSGATRYHWDFGDPSTAADTSALQNPQYTYPGNGKYKVTLIAYGPTCTDTITGYVLIGNDQSAADVRIDGASCILAQVTLTDQSVLSQPAVKYTYAVDGSSYPGNPVSLRFYTRGVHQVSEYISLSNGCIARASKQVTVNAVDVRASNDTMVPAQTMLPLHATGADHYFWTVQSGNNRLSSQNIADPVLDCSEMGQFNVIVIGQDDQGCYGTDTVNVTVTSRAYAFVPTGFTPNSDGHNDVLRPYVSGGEFVSFRVFNRAGRELFYSTNIRDGWDGTYKGKEQGTGVYCWMITLRSNDMPVVQKGDVTLIR